MRKKYIFWWVASSWLLIASGKAAYDMIFFPEAQDSAAFPVLILFLIIAGLCFYTGYRRFQEYQEYQEDRKIRNEYYKSNTKKGDE